MQTALSATVCIIAAPTENQFLGCYQNMFASYGMRNQPSLTIQWCIGYCRDNHYTFAALQVLLYCCCSWFKSANKCIIFHPNVILIHRDSHRWRQTYNFHSPFRASSKNPRRKSACHRVHSIIKPVLPTFIVSSSE